MNERTILRRQDGFSIVELMIAATIGLFLVAGITLIFLNSRKGRDDVLRQSQQNDNGRYAIELLNNEFHTAGFLGEFDPAVLITPVTKPDPCLTDLPSLRSALSQSVQGYDNAATVPSCLSDVRAGTDILVVRRASTCAIGDAGCDALSAGTVYFQASSCNNATELQAASYTAYFGLDSTTSNLTLHLKDCATIAPLRRFRTHIFFVANNDKAGDGGDIAGGGI